MFIFFRCRRCRQVLSAPLRQAGSPFLCTYCRREVLVPSCSDPGCISEPAGCSIPPPAEPMPLEEVPTSVIDPALSIAALQRAPAARPLPIAPAPANSPKLLLPRGSRWRRGAAALGIGILLLLVGLAAGRFLSGERKADVPHPPLPPLPVVERNVPEPTLLASDTGVEESPFRAGMRLGLLHSRPLAAREEVEEPPVEPAKPAPAKPAPPHPVEPPAPEPRREPVPAAPAARPPERRPQLTEEQLLLQLAQMPEMGLTPPDVAAVTNKFAAVFQVSGGTNFEPSTVLSIRPDLAMLPIRSGSLSRLGLLDTVNLQLLSQKLHEYIRRGVPRDFQGQPGEPALLREVMRKEMRGRQAEWLRPEAIPTLQQILMHEDRPLRQLLVDLLADINGRAANVALAQRAVFDLSPEVRASAVAALKDRPARDYRPILVEALRYPWAPAADHAAEALVALQDREAIPHLVSLLAEPDPTAPVSVSQGTLLREVVRLRHVHNCLTCHPPAGTGRDPVPGEVPGARLTRVSTSIQPGKGSPAAPGGGVAQAGGGGGYGGGGASAGSSTTTIPGGNGRPGLNVTTTVNETPLLIRADITYVRQDFSIQLPVAHPLAPSGHRRFDYVVRTRPLSAAEARARRDAGKADYPQRQAVLYALRSLSGQDAGNTTEAWQQLYPSANFEVQVARLVEEVIQAPAGQRERLLLRLRDGKGTAYTQALAGTISRLTGPTQGIARTALAERLARMNADTLRDKLEDDLVEVRRAAALACARKIGMDLVPDLIARLEDPEPTVVQAVRAVLRGKTGKDLGPAAAWREWWNGAAGE